MSIVSQARIFLGQCVFNAQLWFRSSTNFLGKLAHANTADRTYTFQNKDGTIADLADVSASATTVADTASVNLTLTGAQVTADVLPAGVDHNSLANLTVGDVHTQYLPKAGGALTGNVTASAGVTVDGVDVGAHDHSGGTNGVAIPQASVTNLTTDLGNKAPLASPTFTGTPAAPTAAGGTNTTQIATTAFTTAALAAFVGSSNVVTLGTITTGVWNGTAIGATNGGTGQTSWTLGDLLYASATNTLSKLAGNTTTTRKFLTQTGTGSVSAAPAWATIDRADLPAGVMVQQAVNVQRSASTGTTTIPYDDTIPQNTEGDEYITQAIVPTSATNKLVIEAEMEVAASGSMNVIMALFQNSSADAREARVFTVDQGSGAVVIRMLRVMDAGTTSSTTFKVRMGPSSASTLTINGYGGSRKLGGVQGCWLRIMEVRV